MDDVVQQAMAKWPNVPACFGWLALDGRGDWWLRDDRAQALGPFQAAVGGAATDRVAAPRGARGDRLEHPGLIAFIGRNYQADLDGCWFFQNGPQRVYVELSHAPWVLRVQADGTCGLHTGVETTVLTWLCDEDGHVYAQTPQGLALLHTQDVGLAVTLFGLDRGAPLRVHPQHQLPAHFGYVRSPQAQRGAARLAG